MAEEGGGEGGGAVVGGAWGGGGGVGGGEVGAGGGVAAGRCVAGGEGDDAAGLADARCGDLVGVFVDGGLHFGDYLVEVEEVVFGAEVVEGGEGVVGC